MTSRLFLDDIDYQRLAAASPEFRLSQECATDLGLSEIRSLRWVGPAGFTLRITFRRPHHRSGDPEISFKLRCRAAKRRAR